MNVLSLFDGMSCLQIALIELGIKPEKYYASEIDVHAIKQTQLNFPDTVQLGSVTEWRTWDIDWAEIDLIGAGSPCQGFSFAGKQLAFDDPRSKLFFVFVEILNHCKRFNPDVKFLLENVDMKKDHLRVISEYVGVFPVNINSNLVSAQNRNRWYWTNIRTKKVGLFDEIYTDIPQPEDEGILLKDILEEEVDEKYFIKTDPMQKFVTDRWRINKQYTQIDGEKTLPLMARMYASWCGDYVATIQEVRTEEAKQQRRATGTNDFRGKELRLNESGKVSTLQTSPTIEHNLVMLQRSHGFNDGGEVAKDGKTPPMTKSSWEQNNLVATKNYLQDNSNGAFSQPNRYYYEDSKGPTLGIGHAMANPNVLQSDSRIRRLTPTECARLQTVPSWYRWNCSDTQQYRQLGNGWTCKIIQHILQFIK